MTLKVGSPFERLGTNIARIGSVIEMSFPYMNFHVTLQCKPATANRADMLLTIHNDNIKVPLV